MYTIPKVLFVKALDCPPAALRVLIKLLSLKQLPPDHAEWVSIGINQLADECRLSVPTIRKSLRSLEEIGILEISQFQGLQNQYRFPGKQRHL